MVNNYGTVAGADAYHLARGNIVWAGTDEPEKEAALLRASEWIDGNYRMLFPGWKVGNRAQVREWPRNSAYDVFGYLIPADSVPMEAEYATYEAALREAGTPGSLSVDFVGADVIKKAAVDGAVSVEFGGDGSVSAAQIVMPAVDSILAPILTGGAYTTGGLAGSRVRS